MTVTVLALVASGVFLLRLVPQPLRLARRGVDAGLSPLAAMNAVIADGAWLAYGLWADVPAIWLVSLLALVPGVWTVLLLRHRVGAPDVAGVAAWAVVLLAAALGGVFAVALGAGVLVTQGPQVLAALRQSDLRGISPATWRLSLVDAVVWGAYGWMIADPALLGYFAVLSLSAVVVLARLRQTSAGSLAVQPA